MHADPGACVVMLPSWLLLSWVLCLSKQSFIVYTNKQPGIHILPSEIAVVLQGWTEYCLLASKASGRPSAPLLDQAHPWRQFGLLSLLWSLPRPHLEFSRKGGLAHWKRMKNSSADWKTVVIWVAVCRDWSISHATGAGSNSERCPPHGPGSSPNLPTSPSKYITTGQPLNIYRANRWTWQCLQQQEKSFLNCQELQLIPCHIKQHHQGTGCLHIPLQLCIRTKFIINNSFNDKF